jgi:perosamine synthetase
MTDAVAAERLAIAPAILKGREKEYVLECIETGWISSHGRFVTMLEHQFAEYCGVRFAMTCTNGTSALHAALLALDVGPADEVIVPAFSHVSSANVVTYCGAKPVFADCCPDGPCVDPADIEAAISDRTKVIMAAHVLGRPADMGAIREIANSRGIALLENAADAVGARIGSEPVGRFGDCAAFSLHEASITSGEGGVVTSDDEAVADRVRTFKGQGVDPNRRYWHPVIGYNYRMTNVAAAVAVAQMERSGILFSERCKVAAWYAEALRALGDIAMPLELRAGTTPAFPSFAILLEDPNRRDGLIAGLAADGVEARPFYSPIPTLPPYEGQSNRPTPRADALARRGLALPCHSDMAEADVTQIVSRIGQLLG